MKKSLIYAGVVVLCLFQQLAFGVQAAPAQNGADPLRDSLARINEPSVRATVSFLASDELGGRGTPSPGFTIASAYVASRFQAAGLEPGGVDGWYQNREIETSRLPKDGILVRGADGTPVENFGLLSATDARVDYQGPINEIKMADEYTDGQFTGPVFAVETEANATRRYMTSLARVANRLKQAGATALVLVVPDGHITIGLAQGMAGKDRVTNAGQRMPIPVVLVRQMDAAWEIVLSIPPVISGKSVVRNTIGVLKGSDPELSKQAILVTAHLDHLGTDAMAKGDKIYNGADDDASGVTGVLTLADAFSQLATRPKRSIIFMTLWGEESGLLGSKQFAAEPTWPLDQIAANVNIEMIGRPEPGAVGKIWMTGWGESNLGELMNTAAMPAGGTIFEHPQYSAMLYRSSDNWSFAEKGVVAHSFSAGSLHGDYHQLSDEWEKLDTEHMTRVIRSLFHGMMPLTNGEVTPAATAGRRGR